MQGLCASVCVCICIFRVSASSGLVPSGIAGLRGHGLQAHGMHSFSKLGFH